MEKWNLLPLAAASFFGSLCWTSGSHSVFLLLSPSMLHKIDGVPLTSSVKGPSWAVLQSLGQVVFTWQFPNTSKNDLMGPVTIPFSSTSREMESSSGRVSSHFLSMLSAKGSSKAQFKRFLLSAALSIVLDQITIRCLAFCNTRSTLHGHEL